MYALEQNYPNPFNPTTTITYQLPEQRDVTLVVYNILGQVVKSLVQNVQASGTYAVRWDGTNDHGTGVSSGVYIYRLQAGSFVQSRKMMMLR
jgi:flagellar hook assembly protein FlgD